MNQPNNQLKDLPTDQPTNHKADMMQTQRKHKVGDNAYFSFELYIFLSDFL